MSHGKEIKDYEALTKEYAKPGFHGDTRPNWRDDGAMAQEFSSVLWYAVANALAEAALAHPDQSDDQLVRACARRIAEA
jgi:hypothetical protein